MAGSRANHTMAGRGRRNGPRFVEGGGERPPLLKPAHAAATGQGPRAPSPARASRAQTIRLTQAARSRPARACDFGGERPPLPWPAVTGRGRLWPLEAGLRLWGRTSPLLLEAGLSGGVTGRRAPPAHRGLRARPRAQTILWPAAADETVNDLLEARGRTSPLEAGPRGRDRPRPARAGARASRAQTILWPAVAAQAVAAQAAHARKPAMARVARPASPWPNAAPPDGSLPRPCAA